MSCCSVICCRATNPMNWGTLTSSSESMLRIAFLGQKRLHRNRGPNRALPWSRMAPKRLLKVLSAETAPRAPGPRSLRSPTFTDPIRVRSPSFSSEAYDLKHLCELTAHVILDGCFGQHGPRKHIEPPKPQAGGERNFLGAARLHDADPWAWPKRGKHALQIAALKIRHLL